MDLQALTKLPACTMTTATKALEVPDHMLVTVEMNTTTLPRPKSRLVICKRDMIKGSTVISPPEPAISKPLYNWL